MVTVRDIADFAGPAAKASSLPEPDIEVTPAQFDQATERNVTFLGQNWKSLSVPHRAEPIPKLGLLISLPEVPQGARNSYNWLGSPDPRALFARACREFFPPTTASVELAAMELGLRLTGVSAGSRSLTFPWVSLGIDVTIGFGTVIGGDGFGYVADSDGRAIRFPHYGGVQIGNRCEIGSNCSIDRAVFGNTVISDDVKIDNLVHIAHNVLVGPNSRIAAGAVVGGSTRIGRDVWIGAGAIIGDNISIDDGAHVALGSVVLRSVSAGKRVFGNPALPL